MAKQPSILRSGGQRVDNPGDYFLFIGSGPLSSLLGQGTVRQFATVDHADMRGLVTDWTSLRRGAGLSLVAGFIDRECPFGVIPLVDAGIARTRVLHTGPTMP